MSPRSTPLVSELRDSVRELEDFVPGLAGSVCELERFVSGLEGLLSEVEDLVSWLEHAAIEREERALERGVGVRELDLWVRDLGREALEPNRKLCDLRDRVAGAEVEVLQRAVGARALAVRASVALP